MFKKHKGLLIFVRLKSFSVMSTYNQLADLDTSKTTWSVKVRISRMWASVSNSSGTEILKGYNLILLDENVSSLTTSLFVQLSYGFNLAFI